MPDSDLVRVNCTAAYADGTFLFDDEPHLARVTCESAGKAYRVVCLHMLIPVETAEAMENGLRHGRVDLCIENVPSALEAAA